MRTHLADPSPPLSRGVNACRPGQALLPEFNFRFGVYQGSKCCSVHISMRVLWRVMRRKVFPGFGSKHFQGETDDACGDTAKRLCALYEWALVRPLLPRREQQ